MGRTLNYFYVLCAFICVPSIAQEPSQLSPFELYSRCYNRISGLSVPLNDPMRAILSDASSTHEDAIDACLNYLDQVQFDATQNPGTLQVDTPVTRAVLKTFHDFHKTWFPSDNFRITHPGARNIDIYDPSEPALYITNALFGANSIPYSSVVTEPFGFDAKRSLGTPVAGPVTSEVATNFRQWCISCMPASDPDLPGTGCCTVACGCFINQANPYTSVDPFNPLFIELGDLIGMRRIDPTYPSHYNKKISLRGHPGGHYYRRSSGAGVLGSRAFLLLNLGRDQRDGNMNGGRVMARRWSQAVFKTLMCRELPMVHVNDVLSMTSQYLGAGTTLPFRQNASCQTCHAPADLMSGVIRHHRMIPTLNVADSPPYDAEHVAVHALSASPTVYPVPWSFDSIANFHLSAPHGKLFYRDIHNQLKDVFVPDLAAVGAELAASDDIYACAAKRYLQFFTSIDVPISALSADQVKRLSPEAAYFRNLIAGPGGLGAQLKSTQSLKQIIRRILELPWYSNAGFQRN